MVSVLIALVALQPDKPVVLGLVERDLTGDGKAEIVRVSGVATTMDSFDVTLTIESAGTIIYRVGLRPVSRTVGFDAGGQVISAGQQQKRLSEFGRSFFAEEKFQRPAEFVDGLRRAAPLRVAEIPGVIARDRPASETRNGSEIWEEILKSPVTIFTFSPGGDAIEAIGWSARAGRFYRLLECC